MSTQAAALPSSWLRDPAFDYTFIVGVSLLALLSAGLVLLEPALFPYVLTADLWLLGYHHVASTYTRLTFDKASFAEHRNQSEQFICGESSPS